MQIHMTLSCGSRKPAQVVVPLQQGGQRSTFPGLGQSEGVPGVRENFDPEGHGLCVFLGGYVVISCCKLGEGAVGGQDVFVIFFSFFSFSSPLFSTPPYIFFSFYAISVSGMTLLLFSRCCSA